MNNDLFYKKEFSLTAGVEQQINERWRFHEFYVVESGSYALTIKMPNGVTRAAETVLNSEGSLYEGAISAIKTDADCTIVWIGRA